MTVLEHAGVGHVLHRYDHDARATDYGDEAVRALAAALGLDPVRVLKTLVLELGDGLGVAVVPVPARADLKACAQALGARRAELAAPRDAERATGYVVGGMSPLGQRRVLPTVVHAGALDHATVLVSAGRRGLEVELAPTDLVRLTGAVTAAVCARPR